jgi:uncharacterized protein
MKTSTKRLCRIHLMIGAAIILAGAFSVSAQKPYSIAEIQGDKTASPHDKETVQFEGVVTAVLKKGFFVQTPDALADKDPKTSEGIYVFGENSAGQAAVGDLVQVTGAVEEFRGRGDGVYFSTTEITKPTVKVISKGNPLPAPITLSATELDPKGQLSQMERFEGMRVKLDAVVVGPTGGYTNEKSGVSTSNGVFFVTAQGVPRPFREAGIDVAKALLQKLPGNTPTFDMNPEILRVDSQAQVGAKGIDVPSGVTISALTGVIDYSRNFYTLDVDAASPPNVANINGFVAVSPAGERELTVGSFNIENFFDDEVNSADVEKEVTLSPNVFKTRLSKVSLAIRNVLASPDILGVIEVENVKVLKKVADKVNADAVAAGHPDPKYVPYLEEGNDIRGIDVGFLIKSTKVKVLEVKQLGKDDKLDFAGASPNEKLFDRTPLLIRAEVIDAKSPKPLAVSVIVNHLKSYRGIDDEKDGEHTRNKRRLEAEWLARFVEEREKSDPNERLILVGDFNAFQFNDGYNDLIGILKGKPDPNVLNPSKAVFATGLADMIDFIDPKNRYSYSFDGSAQALDHILISKPVRSRVLKFGYARVDADFPLVWSNDASRPERISDHDAPVVFLSLDELPTKPASKP